MISLLAVEIAVAANTNGDIQVHPFNLNNVQTNQKYVEWRDMCFEQGYSITIVRARVPIQESIIDADSVQPMVKVPKDVKKYLKELNISFDKVDEDSKLPVTIINDRPVRFLSFFDIIQISQFFWSDPNVWDKKHLLEFNIGTIEGQKYFSDWLQNPY